VKPSVGRIVHYVSYSGEPLAAIITKVHSLECVNLVVFTDGSPYSPDEVSSLKLSVMIGLQPGQWHWPERV
jgi:hypothetical protein